jgi:hypothetical protein
VQRTGVLFAFLIVTSSCFGQTAQLRFDQLIEHWQWQQYWNDATELGPRYQPGRAFQALVFWDTRQGKTGIGFCSRELGVCQFYPTFRSYLGTETLDGEDDVTAFERFRKDSLEEESASSVRRSPLLSRPPSDDFRSEPLNVTLPEFTPPKAIREKQKPPEARVQALKLKFACSAAAPRCHIHVLIPYFSEEDPYVPVFAECPTCDFTQPIILLMQFAEGNWSQGATDKNSDPKFVQLTKEKIERALLIEIK